MVRYKIKLQNLQTNKVASTIVKSRSLADAITDAINSLSLDKQEWYLKKYSVIR